MIVNPIVFRKEYTELSVYKPICYVDKRCPVTTPWDMIINQFYEEVRGASRHGSCGMGIGSTIDRENNGNIDLHIASLFWNRAISWVRSGIANVPSICATAFSPYIDSNI